MSRQVPVYWACPKCEDSEAVRAIHTGCGGALYRDLDEEVVYCCVCGAEITYFTCDECKNSVYL